MDKAPNIYKLEPLVRDIANDDLPLSFNGSKWVPARPLGLRDD